MKAMFILLLSLSFHCLWADQSVASQKEINWTFTRELAQNPRGGTTIGPKVTYDESIPTRWIALQEPGLTRYERDRRAILALTGSYEVKFEFIESFLIDTAKNLDRPYASKATEFIKVIEDRGDFISLQHTLVMFFKHNGQIQGPIVTKHWRQDWQWEGSERFIFQGDKQWNRVPVKANEVEGKWVWSVYHVDDSPRYTGIGEWEHYKSASVFETNTMSRPLPRREFSVRNDYELLMGKETLVLTPQTWYHEQKAFKHKNKLKNSQFNGSFLARELGQNTYKRIKNFDWSAGEKYWAQTKGYWSDVRAVWRDLFSRQSVTLRKKVNNQPLYTRHFNQAKDPKVLSLNSSERQTLIKKTIFEYIK